jgi:phosphate/sulfate permease
MDTGLAVAVLLAVAFAVTKGLHDASNAIATLVATRAASPCKASGKNSLMRPSSQRTR